MSAGRLDELNEFLRQDPDDTFTHYAIALEYVSLRKIPEAIAKFDEVIGLDPNYVPAYHQKGLLLAGVNRTEDALRTFEQGIRIAALTGDRHAQSEMQEALDGLEHD